MLETECQDQVLWDLFLSGDDTAYSSIYKLYVQPLYSYGVQFTFDSGLVEDSIHDLFVKLYQNRKNLHTTDNIKLYLFAALKNQLFDIFKKNVSFSQIDTIEPVFVVDYTIEDEIIKDEQERLLIDKVIYMLEVLTPRQKEVIYYRYQERLSYDEICKIMGMNYQSIQNLLQRSFKKLRTTFSHLQLLSVSALGLIYYLHFLFLCE